MTSTLHQFYEIVILCHDDDLSKTTSGFKKVQIFGVPKPNFIQ